MALRLAAAGVGRLMLAHAGPLRPDDLNRQLLMRTWGIGRLRMESAVETLRALNPHVDVTAIDENITVQNAETLVAVAGEWRRRIHGAGKALHAARGII